MNSGGHSMISYDCHFLFCDVLLVVRMMTQGTKHGVDPLDAACETLAERLGATYLYREELK